MYFWATDSYSHQLDPDDPPDIVRIEVSASWFIGQQQKYVHNYTELSDWREN